MGRTLLPAQLLQPQRNVLALQSAGTISQRGVFGLHGLDRCGDPVDGRGDLSVNQSDEGGQRDSGLCTKVRRE
jgi:hypothetical protein